MEANQARSNRSNPFLTRTGTLMAIDIEMDSLQSEWRVCDVYGCLYRMRKDRAGSIQTFGQYLFVHQVDSGGATLVQLNTATFPLPPPPHAQGPPGLLHAGEALVHVWQEPADRRWLGQDGRRLLWLFAARLRALVPRAARTWRRGQAECRRQRGWVVFAPTVDLHRRA